MDFQSRSVQFLLVFISVIALSFTAEKCRQLVGEEDSSKSGKFTLLNCFDMGSGSIACTVKEGVKLYSYNIRTTRVEKARHRAIESALIDSISQGLSALDAAKQAQKEGIKAAKLASRQAKRVIGPIISSGWDFFEAIYYGGTMGEGFLRGFGTLFGTYAGGFLGEQKIGRFGYIVGSHLGSWVGGRVGLMIYDVARGVRYFFWVVDAPRYGSSDVSEDSYGDDMSSYMPTTYENSEDTYGMPSDVPTSYENSEDSYGNDMPLGDVSPPYENSEDSYGNDVLTDVEEQEL